MGRREISPAVKDQAVQMIVSEGRTVMQVCELLGVGPTAVRRWVAQQRTAPVSVPTTPQARADQQRITALEAKVARLQEERDLLKKSMAFFVRENDRPRR
jgi:transposase